jgi:hypothetical protein
MVEPAFFFVTALDDLRVRHQSCRGRQPVLLLKFPIDNHSESEK